MPRQHVRLLGVNEVAVENRQFVSSDEAVEPLAIVEQRLLGSGGW